MASMEELLLQLGNISNALLHDTEALVPPSSSQPVPGPSVIPPLHLDDPDKEDLLSDLLAAGAPSDFAEELCTIHIDRSAELAAEYTRLYEQTCSTLSFVDHPQPSSLYSRVARLRRNYDQKVSAWTAELIDLVKAKCKRRTSEATEESGVKTQFNYSFLPMLETFFDVNRLPSLADRKYMAKKSGMTLRQINVWFQNRRARTKDKSAQANVSERSSFQPRKDFRDGTPVSEQVVDTDEGSTDVEDIRTWSRASSFTLVEEDVPFFQKPPNYAYPVKYPPKLSEIEPFPCMLGDFTFPKPAWERSAFTGGADRTEVDMDSLVSEFTKLSIAPRAAPPVNMRRPSVPYEERGCGAISPFTIRPFPAPLPSLVRPSPCIPSFRQRSPVRNRTCASRLRAAQSTAPRCDIRADIAICSNLGRRRRRQASKQLPAVDDCQSTNTVTKVRSRNVRKGAGMIQSAQAVQPCTQDIAASPNKGEPEMLSSDTLSSPHTQACTSGPTPTSVAEINAQFDSPTPPSETDSSGPSTPFPSDSAEIPPPIFAFDSGEFDFSSLDQSFPALDFPALPDFSSFDIPNVGLFSELFGC